MFVFVHSHRSHGVVLKGKTAVTKTAERYLPATRRRTNLVNFTEEHLVPKEPDISPQEVVETKTKLKDDWKST